MGEFAGFVDSAHELFELLLAESPVSLVVVAIGVALLVVLPAIARRQRQRDRKPRGADRDRRRAGLRTGAPVRSGGTPAGAFEQSPGREGPQATRDLSPEELRGLQPSYSPSSNGVPDGGEVVWTWVPFAENDGRGKDRPVLVIGRLDDLAVAGCYLTSSAKDRFVSVGIGTWDRQGRESYAAPDRVLRISDAGVRREGGMVSYPAYDRVVQAIAKRHRLHW